MRAPGIFAHPQHLTRSPLMKRLFRAFVILHSAVVIQAAEPPSAPLLRIEAGMHTATIRRIATDAAGRVALTCSDDKTARLWQPRL